MEDQAAREDPNPYPLLAAMKQTVKSQMLKLAKCNCEHTIVLMENHFAEGDFQE